MEVTLMELLDSREQRVWHQQELLEKYGGSLVSVTLNIPGPIKDKPQYRKVMEWGMEALLGAFGPNVMYKETRFLKTGAEGYVCIDGLEPEEAKYIAVLVESMAPKARLLDIDVMGKDGAVSRRELGLEPRKCLLCDEDAKACARSQKHSMEELLEEVEKLCYY
ncbi:MAG: citrate lyase holo-[Firmicutes bacterium]|nr:citrate lyase holo-[acyl-carrier protein] synthase [Bacillota bacterium]